MPSPQTRPDPTPRRPGTRTAAALAVTAVLLTVGPSGASATPPGARRSASPAPERPVAAAPPAPAPPIPTGPLRTADLLVTGPALPATAIAAIRRLPAVSGVEPASAAATRIDGQQAELMAVDPATFRVWTPAHTARSDPLWRDIATGAAAVSFDFGQQAALPLGGIVPVTARRTRLVRIDAFATVGIAGVDAIVSTAQGALLGLPAGNILLISAPHADPLALRAEITGLAGPRHHVELLRQLIVIRNAGEFLTNQAIDTLIRAAWSRIGLPYVWGATGPAAFDCSGLVGWSYAQAGISLPRTSEQQWLAGVHIPLADAQPGDLLFWTYDPTDPTNVDHVALYVGHGMMIVAPHTGQTVTYQPIPPGPLAGVVRVDPAAAASVGGPRFTIR